MSGEKEAESELKQRVEGLEKSNEEMLVMIEKNAQSIAATQKNLENFVTLISENLKKALPKQGGKKKTKKLKGRITRKGKTMKRRIIV